MSSHTRSGVIANCLRCHIYTEPSTESRIVTSLSALADILVNDDESTDEFYKVVTESSAEGYCEKKYVALPLA